MCLRINGLRPVWWGRAGSPGNEVGGERKAGPSASGSAGAQPEGRDGNLPYCNVFSISVTGIAPSRSTFQLSPCNSMIVDGKAAPVSPASSTSGNRLPSCLITCSPLVQDGNPETFALVPVIGPSNSLINISTRALFGQRSATLPVLAVTFNGTRLDASITSVSAPGQN